MRHDLRPRAAKLTLKRESLRDLSADNLRAAAGGYIHTDTCPPSVETFCTYSIARGTCVECLPAVVQAAPAL